MTRSDKAVQYFRNKFNCSQAVFTAFGTDSGLLENECLKIACAFGGGMGRTQQTCGAVTGALMVLGLRFGKGIDDPEEMKTNTYKKTREFFDEFIKLHGSTNCRVLLNGLDMDDPDDHKKILDQKLFEIRCEKYVADAAEIAGRIISK
jgi:C_GCAxxG_C_C family probable redox protein